MSAPQTRYYRMYRAQGKSPYHCADSALFCSRRRRCHSVMCWAFCCLFLPGSEFIRETKTTRRFFFRMLKFLSRSFFLYIHVVFVQWPVSAEPDQVAHTKESVFSEGKTYLRTGLVWLLECRDRRWRDQELGLTPALLLYTPTATENCISYWLYDLMMQNATQQGQVATKQTWQCVLIRSFRASRYLLVENTFV